MQPYNYNIDVKSPLEAAVQGYGAGLAIRKNEQAALLADQQRVQQMQLQNDLGALAIKQSPVASDYVSMMTRYPQLAEHFKKSWDVLNAEQQQSALQKSTRIYAALQGNEPDVAISVLTSEAAALRNSGKEHEAKAAEALAELTRTLPGAARALAGSQLASFMGGEKFAQMNASLGKERRDAEQAPADFLKKTADASKAQSEAANSPQRLALEASVKQAQSREIDAKVTNDAARLGLDRDKLQSETQLKMFELNQKATTLTDDTRKLVNDSAQAAVTSLQSMNQLDALAEKIEKASISGGVPATVAEVWAKGWGSQDELTRLRQEYSRVRGKEIAKHLPPGPASDKDIQFAQKGIPEDTANAETLVSFIRGMSKISYYDSAMSNARAEWANAVGHLGKPRADIDVDGIRVAGGTTFSDFNKKYLQRKSEDYDAQRSVNQASGRSYMKYATPQKPRMTGPAEP